MHRKKFKPIITRVKLNPEQAVLSCSCYDSGRLASTTVGSGSACSSVIPRDSVANVFSNPNVAIS